MSKHTEVLRDMLEVQVVGDFACGQSFLSFGVAAQLEGADGVPNVSEEVAANFVVAGC